MKTYDILIRVSNMGGREVAAETTMTLRDQEARGVAAIAERGGRLGKVIKAPDVSGFIAYDSPQYREAVERQRRGDANGLVISYGDRFMRNWRKAGRMYDDLEEAGAEVVIAEYPQLDYRTPEGRQHTGMMAVASEMTYFTNKARGDSIAATVVARGVPNRVPFGYRRNADADGVKVDSGRDAKALVPDPHVAPLLAGIFERRADGHPWAAIARWLDEHGVAPKTPKRRDGRGTGAWTVSTLKNMIANEVYLGVVQLGARRLEGAHEPLVTRALWNAAQSSITVQRTGRNAAGIAGGLLRCGCCGRVLSVTGTNPAYTCRRTIGGKCKRATYVSKRRADEFVERAVVDVLQHGSLDVIASNRDVDRLRREWDDAGVELDNYVVTASSLNAQLFKRGLDTRQAKVDETRAAYDDAISGAEAAATLPDASGWAALNLDGRRRVARALIDKVIVKPPESIRDRGPNADVFRRFEIRWNGAG